jgi:general secretion pathway protein J
LKADAKQVDMNLINRGFTLIEVLISITLLGVILVTIFGGLRIGFNAWETGEKNLDFQQHQQTILNFMQCQLASARAVSIETSDDRNLVFIGKPNAMAFVSSHSIMPGNIYGDVYVQYWVEDDVDGSMLKIYENNTLFESLTGELSNPSRSGMTYNLGRIENLSLFYLRKGQGESTWSDQWEWKTEEEEKLPAAIRCVFQINKDMPPIELFVATKASTIE